MMMDISEPIDGVVADSEDEYGGTGGPLLNWNSVALSAKTSFVLTPDSVRDPLLSHISDFSGSGHRPVEAVLSSIGRFPSANANISILASSKETEVTPALSKSRPKPRPTAPKKKHVDEGSLDSRVSSFSFLDHPIVAGTSGKLQALTPAYLTDFNIDEFPVMSSIADRAKTRQRNSGTSKMDDSEISSNSVISVVKGKMKVPVISDDVIELSSDDDELNLKTFRSTKSKLKSSLKSKSPKTTTSLEPIPIPTTTDKPKPRPRPRPIIKKSNVPLPDPCTGSLPIDSILSSDSSTKQRRNAIPSSLPPSDFSFPTSGPSTDLFDHPPIETLPGTGSDLDHDGASSGPSSSFERRGDKTPYSAIDELFSGDDDKPFDHRPRGHALNAGVGPPPPTFFAGSSSFDKDIDMDKDDERVLPEPEVVDLTMFPTEPQPRIGVTIISKPLKVKSKDCAERKKKKLQKDKDEGDWGASQDEDVDREEGNRKKSKKVKTKAKAKAKNVSSPTNAQVQVVITNLPPAVKSDTKTKKKTTAKAKGKEKETEFFKSKEFIDDSDDEVGSLALGLGSSRTGVVNLALNLTSESGSGSKSTSESNTSRLEKLSTPARELSLEPLSPLSDNVPLDDEMRSSTTSTKKKKRKSVGDGDESDLEKKTGSSNKKQKQSKEKKTRADAILGADFDDVDMCDVLGDEVVVVNRGRGSKNKDWDGKSAERKTKAKNVVLSSNEEGEYQDTNLEHTSSPELGGKQRKSKKVVEDEDEELADPEVPEIDSAREKKNGASKENVQPLILASKNPPMSTSNTPIPQHPPLYKRYSIAPRTKSTPMTELIKRVNSLPSSPFSSAHASRSAIKGTAYSPYLKSSRSALSRIAPLHPNRRTPPPPLPPPPPRKKTKKELEREEQWEEELVDSVGGSEEWAILSDVERSDLRRMKREREMAGWED